MHTVIIPSRRIHQHLAIAAAHIRGCDMLEPRVRPVNLPGLGVGQIDGEAEAHGRVLRAVAGLSVGRLATIVDGVVPVRLAAEEGADVGAIDFGCHEFAETVVIHLYPV